jgi:hypothetical protein
MKKILLLFLLSICFAGVYAQDTYNVQAVKGEVKDAKGKLLSKGIKLLPADKITFGKGAMLLVSNQKFGRLVLQPSANTKTKPDLPFALTMFIPAAKRISTKNTFVMSEQVDFQNFLAKEKILIAGTDFKLMVNKKAYPMDANNFFYIRYKNKAETVNMRLDSKDSLLFFNKSYFTDNAGVVIAKPTDLTDLELYYYDNLSDTSTLLTKLVMSFLDDTQIRTEIQSVVDMFKADTAPKDDYPKEIGAYLSQYYTGKTDLDNIAAWFTKNFKI